MGRNRDDPRLHGCTPIKGAPEGQCCACLKPPAFYVRIEADDMRGNDEVLSACKRHKKMAQSNLGQFFGHVRSKAKHFNIQSQAAANG